MQLYKKYAKYIVIALLIYMPIFGHLDSLPIRIWDEARLAINALEMYENGNYLVTHFEGKPDLWNTKPPLLIWIQVFFLKIIGINELAIRLPSAIAAAFTCFLLMYLSRKYFKSFSFGLISILVLITSNGYISEHGTRTGDYDALLTLFLTLSALSFFAYTENKKKKWIYIFFISTAMAVMTKSVAGLLFLPSLFVYLLIRKQLLQTLKNKHFYFGTLILLSIIFGYYFLRELNNPGYLEAVYYNEIGGRYLDKLEGHGHYFWHYYDMILSHRYNYWYSLIPCGIALGIFSNEVRLKRLTIFSSLIVILYFLIISNGKTKLFWYDLPMYPFLAIICSMLIYHIYSFIKQSKSLKQSVIFNVFPYIFIFSITVIPYKKIINKTYLPKEKTEFKEFYKIGYFLKDALNGKFNLDKNYIAYNGYYAQNLFYIKALNHKGIDVSLVDWRKLNPGDSVIESQENVKQYIQENYCSNQTNINEHITKHTILQP